ncbi:ribonuclease HII [Candidatus Woesearchaeota archaeon]|nr:ribonuclease HII [Candidatus Woesearchaeota archaeon]
MVFVVGIDEAGRGPIIGPLVIAGVLINEEDSTRLKSIGARDSKLLTGKKRILLGKQILKIIKNHKIIIVQPEEIDKAVHGYDALNLNWLEARKTAELINYLKSDRAIIDCPSPNINAYKNYLKKYLNNPEIELIVEHKADKNHVEVSAASIIAKNKRDYEVELIEKKIGQKIGTGYMSNPQCQKFVKENFDKHPELFRKSWMTYKKQVEEKEQKKLNEY